MKNLMVQFSKYKNLNPTLPHSSLRVSEYYLVARDPHQPNSRASTTGIATVAEAAEEVAVAAPSFLFLPIPPSGLPNLNSTFGFSLAMPLPRGLALSYQASSLPSLFLPIPNISTILTVLIYIWLITPPHPRQTRKSVSPAAASR